MQGIERPHGWINSLATMSAWIMMDTQQRWEENKSKNNNNRSSQTSAIAGLAALPESEEYAMVANLKVPELGTILLSSSTTSQDCPESRKPWYSSKQTGSGSRDGPALPSQHLYYHAQMIAGCRPVWSPTDPNPKARARG